MASILPVFVPHEGCPCRCVFCNQNTIAGQTQSMTAQRAREILEEGLSRLPSSTKPQAAFYGGSFTAIDEELQEELFAVTDEFWNDGRIADVRLSTRPDGITQDILDRLRAHHVSVIELGAQSMDETVLLLSGRGHTAQDTVRAAELIQKNGFSLILQTMAGLPGDTRETCRQTAQRIAALKPDGVRIYPVVVLPHTELYDLWQSGKYHALTPDEAAEWCADMLEVFEPAGIPVIRLGLNPTEDLNSSYAAGAYHPAMGELAYNALWYRRLRRRVLDGETVLTVPSRRLSMAIGQKWRNLQKLREEFPDREIWVKAKE